MKKYLNGVIVEMTDEEIAKIERLRAEAEAKEANREPSTEERLVALESAILEMIMGGTL